MTKFDLSEHPHNRKNILTGEWILVSPHRSKRPWQGKVETLNNTQRPHYDESCYLCPGNKRSDGIESNPDYKSTYIFDNDFSALKMDVPEGEVNKNDLLVAKSESGKCKVICFSPRHDLTLPEMSVSDIKSVIDTWINEYIELGKLENINYVQIFENKGEIMGCSNPHPHGQIWS
ncbi:galactose-1-phosphate uridylyltransferase, partial [bacterium]